MWNRILVKLRLRTDWADPRNAPPFVPDTPHSFEIHDTLECCARCGGGAFHPIHHGKQTAYRPSRVTDETTRMMTGAGGEWR